MKVMCESLFYFEPNSIELLGYAKNNIAEAKEKATDIPQEYLDKLNAAFSLVNEVQEHLFDNPKI